MIDRKLQAEFDRLIQPGDVNVVIGTRTWHGLGWTHVDIDPSPLIDSQGKYYPVDVVSDARNIQLPSNYADLVFSQECLEHFSKAEYPKVLDEWCRIVKPDGRIMIQVPDFLACCRQVIEVDTLEMDRAIMQLFYGGQVNEWDYHYNGFTSRILEEDLVNREFEVEDIKLGFEAGFLQIIGRKL